MKLTILFRLAAVFVAALLFLPFITLFVQALAGDSEYFSHIAQTVLADYTLNSVLIAVLTSSFACLIGVPLAWWVSHYDFPGRQFFHWALILPLALPPYIVGYLYTDLFDYSGIVQRILRELFTWQSQADYWFFDMRSRLGAAIVLALVLYPYVYVIARTAFSQQSTHLRQAAQTLGANSRRIFWTIHLPLARPAIVIGASLVAMEALADFGTVNLFAVSTLTTAVYESWLEYGSLGTAAKLSCILLLTIFAILALERFSRRAQHQFEKFGGTIKRRKAHRYKGVAMTLVVATVLFFAFILPFSMLTIMAWDYAQQSWNTTLLTYIGNSLLLGCIVAVICLFFALFLNLFVRFNRTPATVTMQQVAGLGYAVPGTVMAIGVMIPLAFTDLQIHNLVESWTGTGTGLLLSGSIFAIVYAYFVRFFAIANGSMESGLLKISPSLDMAAATLGSSRSQVSRRIHIPLLMPSMLTALLLVFIECIKELPAALLLRPFGYETLATHIYQFASDEQLEMGAIGALLIVAVGLLPLWFINKNLMAAHNG